jgi:hypothetical protein
VVLLLVIMRRDMADNLLQAVKDNLHQVVPIISKLPLQQDMVSQTREILIKEVPQADRLAVRHLVFKHLLQPDSKHLLQANRPHLLPAAKHLLPNTLLLPEDNLLHKLVNPLHKLVMDNLLKIRSVHPKAIKVKVLQAKVLLRAIRAVVHLQVIKAVIRVLLQAIKVAILKVDLLLATKVKVLQAATQVMETQLQEVKATQFLLVKETLDKITMTTTLQIHQISIMKL